MDRVRFGRVLGSGARAAAKTVVQAIDAAKADNPVRTPVASVERRQPERDTVQSPSRPTPSTAPSSGVQSPMRITRQGSGVRQGAGRFRDLALKPFVRLSGVLMLEVAGVFFGIFALYGFNTMWRAHGSWHTGSPNHRQFVGGALMLALFGYFCITSFVRARRRERGR
ncbi:MAG TPA: hypothetical protein VJU82_12640 [Acidobacteriaceae bacterium]|nr:hypothetical protein [Acidobacteriaceae bacterium]